MPIGVYAGLEITGASVKDAVTSADHQTEAVLALHERFNTQVMLTAMDLSAEAETFGCEVRMLDDEIPTVIGRLVTTGEEYRSADQPNRWRQANLNPFTDCSKFGFPGEWYPSAGRSHWPFFAGWPSFWR